MPNRMTVVFDDPDLYRRVKIRAIEEGVPAKVIIERALRESLGEQLDTGHYPKFTAAVWEEWQAESERLEQELGPGPTDLSNVKKYLYGEESEFAERPGQRRIAEEPAEFDRQ